MNTKDAVPAVREPKASRIRVWQAVERIVAAGRRPTVEGVRELLGGGSPNSVTAYINEWYQELGHRLEGSESPIPGLPREVVSLLAEIWRVAAGPKAGSAAVATVASELRDAEHSALVAETNALETLNKELQKHRLNAERSLADTRALLVRREAALEREQAQTALLEQALAQVRLDLEILRERQRLTPARLKAAPRPLRRRARKPKAARAPSKAAVRTGKKSSKQVRGARKTRRRPRVKGTRRK